MLLCKNCSKYGRVIAKQQRPAPVQQKTGVQKEHVVIIVDGYGRLVKNAREKRGLKQEELAMKISEKESDIHAIESERREPSVALARKLERFLGITLVEEEDIAIGGKEKSSSSELTLGDMLKKK